jgi:mono/diheme cytochrome c family protein
MRIEGRAAMKNRVLAMMVAAFGVALATGAVYADLKKGYYSPEQLGSIQQAAPVAFSTDANYEVSAYPVPTLELAPGDGRQDVQIYCNTCHSPRYITMQPPLPAATWEAEVNKMQEAYGAGIPDDTVRKIIAYLQAHYTPETRKL